MLLKFVRIADNYHRMLLELGDGRREMGDGDQLIVGIRQ